MSSCISAILSFTAVVQHMFLVVQLFAWLFFKPLPWSWVLSPMWVPVAIGLAFLAVIGSIVVLVKGLCS